MDAIEQQAYIEMVKAITKRQEWFNKEVASMKKKEQKLLKRLEAIEAPKREEARLAAEAEAAASRPDLKKTKTVKGKRMNAKERAAEEERLRKEEEERKAREEEEARLKAEEEERKRKEEEEKKAAAAKDKNKKPGKKGAQEEQEEQVEETEEQKLDR